MLSKVFKATVGLVLPILSITSLAYAITPDEAGSLEIQSPVKYSNRFNTLQASVTKSSDNKPCQAKNGNKSGYESIELDTPGGENWQLVVNHTGIGTLDRQTLRVKKSD